MLNSLNLDVFATGKVRFFFMNPFKERQIFADNCIVGQKKKKKNLTSENLEYFYFYSSIFANPWVSGKNIGILADPILKKLHKTRVK